MAKESLSDPLAQSGKTAVPVDEQSRGRRRRRQRPEGHDNGARASPPMLRMFELLNPHAESVQALAALLALAFTVLGAIFLYRQISDPTASGAAVYESLLQVDEQLITYPELYPYFYGGVSAEVLDAESRARVDAIAEMKMDSLDFSLSNIERSGASYSAWRQYIVDSFEGSPALVAFLRNHCEWYVQSEWSWVLEAIGEENCDAWKTPESG